MSLLAIAFSILRAFLKNKTDMAAENLCLRQQLAVLSMKSPRPKLAKRDRIFWVWMSKVWSNQFHPVLRGSSSPQNSPRFPHPNPRHPTLSRSRPLRTTIFMPGWNFR